MPCAMWDPSSPQKKNPQVRKRDLHLPLTSLPHTFCPYLRYLKAYTLHMPVHIFPKTKGRSMIWKQTSQISTRRSNHSTETIPHTRSHTTLHPFIPSILSPTPQLATNYSKSCLTRRQIRKRNANSDYRSKPATSSLLHILYCLSSRVHRCLSQERLKHTFHLHLCYASLRLGAIRVPLKKMSWFYTM